MTDQPESAPRQNDWFAEAEVKIWQRLAERGFDQDRSRLLLLCPDSGATFFGKIIRQDGRIFGFDIALDNLSADEFEDVSYKILGTKNARNAKANRDTMAKYRQWMEENGISEIPPYLMR